MSDNIKKSIQIIISAIAQKVLPDDLSESIIAQIKGCPNDFPVALATAEALGKPDLKRRLLLSETRESNNDFLDLRFNSSQVIYQDLIIGEVKLLFKFPLPGELQARLAIESITDRFLEYLAKLHQIIVLDESPRHVQVFMPGRELPDFTQLWYKFINEVAFSLYGLPKYQLPGLAQTFISVLNSVSLADRGFSTLDIPILNAEQAKILAALYFAVWRDTKKRQDDRMKKIASLQAEVDTLEHEIKELDSGSKEFKAKEKELKSRKKQIEDAEKKQKEEMEKYQDSFQKSFGESLEKHNKNYKEISHTEGEIRVSVAELKQPGLSKTAIKKLENKIKSLQEQREKLVKALFFSKESTQQKLELLQESQGDPFRFLELDRENNQAKFQDIAAIATQFTKTATDQINATRGDIFAKCMIEMYRLIEMLSEQFEDPPKPLLTESSPFLNRRSPGDESKEFCYSCGVVIDPKVVQWQVLRFIFQSPSQRRQSASSEGRPHICSSCSALAFASPLKLTDDSIILRLEPIGHGAEVEMRLKNYLRMITTKEMHLSAGRYVALVSEKNQNGDSASQKLGQVQYALAKVASIFPTEVLSDFHFSLMVQGGEVIRLASRHLIFIKGLITHYGQTIMTGGKDINMNLGDAVRYVQQDLPYLAEYTILKNSTISNNLEMEKIRATYWGAIQADLTLKGDSMNSDTPLAKRARLYRDVAALTGLTWAFANSLESTAKKAMSGDDAEREVAKLIEKVDDPIAFGYYATLGDESKTRVEARFWRNSDNEFIYSQTKALLEAMNILDREEKGEDGRIWLNLYADDLLSAYTYFAEKKDYSQEKDWKELTYNVKLSLYTRFPELVRKLKTTGGK